MPQDVALDVEKAANFVDSWWITGAPSVDRFIGRRATLLGKPVGDGNLSSPTHDLRARSPRSNECSGSRRTTMPKLHKVVGVAGATAVDSRLKHPVLSRRWLRDAVAANRSAFEVEMRRERRRLLDSRFDTFWKETSARQA
jgi:hypothetical protein